MPDLIPIKVTLRRRNADGSPRVDQRGHQTVWPSFRSLTVLGGRTPSAIIDEHTGWMINKEANLGTGAEFGEAVALVPPDFATEAAATVDSCEILTDADVGAFLDTKHFPYVQAIKRDADELVALKAQRDLLTARGRGAAELAALDKEIDDALDPANPAPGVRKMRPGSWAELKAARKITVPQS